MNEHFFVKSVRTTKYGIRSLRYTGSNLWNSLPITFKEITSFSRFFKTIKKLLTVGVPLKPLNFFQASSFQLLKLENSLR